MEGISKIQGYIRNPLKAVRPLAELGFLRWMPDVLYLRLAFRGETGKRLDLRNPKTFNEKLQWLKLHDRNPMYSVMVDKYLVKAYVCGRIGRKYIIPTLGVWEKAEEIDFSLLPRKFVLKCTHGSHCNVIVTDKEQLDIDRTVKRLNQWLRHSWYWLGREWPYKNLKPRIIAESYIDSGKGVLTDYKVLCFHGKPMFIEVHNGRFTEEYTQDVFTADWIRTGMEQEGVPGTEEPMKAPALLGKMLELSGVLAEGIRHVRIDWYINGDQLLFGEMTFYDGSGFSRFAREEDNLYLGSLIQLPE